MYFNGFKCKHINKNNHFVVIVIIIIIIIITNINIIFNFYDWLSLFYILIIAVLLHKYDLKNIIFYIIGMLKMYGGNVEMYKILGKLQFISLPEITELKTRNHFQNYG